MRFNNVEHAISWAFQVSATPIVKTSSIQRMMGGGRSFGDMTPHDRHAMAAMIIDQAERAIDKQGMTLLRALFGVADPVEIRAYLVPMVAAGMPTGIHSRRAIEDIISAYCGRRRGVEQIRRALACRKSTALDVRRDAYARLDDVYHRAVGAADEVFAIAGIVSAGMAMSY